MSCTIKRPWKTGDIKFVYGVSYASIEPGWVWCDGVAPGAPDFRDKFPLIFGRINGTTAESDIDGTWKSTGGNTEHYHSYNFDECASGGDLCADPTGDAKHIPEFVVFGAQKKL